MKRIRRGDGSRDSYFHRLRNAEVVLSLAEEKKVDLIVHGHLHQRFVHPRGRLASFAIANPGAVAYKNSAMAYHIYTVDDGEVFLETRRFDTFSVEFMEWKDAPGNGKIT